MDYCWRRGNLLVAVAVLLVLNERSSAQLDPAASGDKDVTGKTSRTWYVSTIGNEHENCGSISNPCSEFSDVNTTGYDSVTISVNSTSREANISCVSHTLEVNDNLTISSFTDGYAYLICQPSASKPVLRFVAANRDSVLILQNLYFEHIQIVVVNASVIVNNCMFSEIQFEVNADGSLGKTVAMRHTQWYASVSCADNCFPSGNLTLFGSFSDISLSQSIFSHTMVNIKINTNCAIEMTECLVTNDKEKNPVEGGVFIFIWTTAVQSTVNVVNSTFEHQFSRNPVENVMNLFESALLVRYHAPPNAANNVRVYIDNCTFYDNERALTFQGPTEHIHLHASKFISNIAMHAGAGILLLTNKSLLITDCAFEHNAAGKMRADLVTPPGTSFALEDDEARLFSSCCKGSVSLVGKGGAIRVQRGQVQIENTHFSNNTARVLGGSIFIDRGSTVTLTNASFYNTPSLELASQQGDILFSSGKVEADGVRIRAQSAANHISLFHHSGDHWSVSIYNVDVECPIGYRLRIMNTSSMQVVQYTGLRKSYNLDQLSYFCEACPRYKYSLEMGSYYYKIDRSQAQAGYYTLMINGENPSSEFPGELIYKDITCLKCPYGGNCDHDLLRALPNFWGYIHNGTIRFQLCPKGYCCSLKLCPTFNTCAKNRQGRLCSECIEGHTEALFSSKCVSNDACGPYWLWAFLFGMGLLYALLLFYQKDIRDFIFSKPEFPCKRCKNKDDKQGNEEEKENCLSAVNSANDAMKAKGEEETRHACIMVKLNKASLLTEPNHNGVTKLNSDGFSLSDDLSSRNNRYHGDKPETEVIEKAHAAADIPTPPPATDFGAIMLITILYYFQDAQLLHVKTAFAAPEPAEWALIKAILLGLFKFRLEIAHFVDNVCLIVGLRASMKLLVRTIMVPYVLALFGLLYLMHWLCCGRLRKDPNKTFESRLSMGFMLALLFTYQMLATGAFTLLSCVPVGNHNVLFIDATVTCYSGWQYGVLAYAMTCIIPFSFVLMLGPGLLQEGRISVGTFFTACLIPLPFVIVWFILRIFKIKTVSPQRSDFPSPPEEVAIKVLQGPFKDIRTRVTGPLCWAGVLIFRRLLLVLLYTFINITLFRLLAMLIVCFIILMNQVHVKPYRDPRANVAGSAAVAALIFVGCINLVRAGFEAAEYTPHGPYKLLIAAMQQTEDVLMLWIPLAFMIVMGVLIILKLVLIFIRCLIVEK